MKTNRQFTPTLARPYEITVLGTATTYRYLCADHADDYDGIEELPRAIADFFGTPFGHIAGECRDCVTQEPSDDDD